MFYFFLLYSVFSLSNSGTNSHLASYIRTSELSYQYHISDLFQECFNAPHILLIWDYVTILFLTTLKFQIPYHAHRPYIMWLFPILLPSPSHTHYHSLLFAPSTTSKQAKLILNLRLSHLSSPPGMLTAPPDLAWLVPSHNSCVKSIVTSQGRLPCLSYLKYSVSALFPTSLPGKLYSFSLLYFCHSS